jgi:hypothetical protein
VAIKSSASRGRVRFIGVSRMRGCSRTGDKIACGSRAKAQESIAQAMVKAGGYDND